MKWHIVAVRLAFALAPELVAAVMDGRVSEEERKVLVERLVVELRRVGSK